MAAGLVAAGAAWAIGREASRRIESHDIEIASRRQPPAPGSPAATRTAENNNMIMQMGFVPDLDGTAIAYAAEANRLVVDGQFRIDRSLEQMAGDLRIGRDAIANPRSPDESDPDAELFRAQAGTLTEKAKEYSRTVRGQQMREGKKPDFVLGEWVIRNFSFTISRLKHPSDEEKIILSAIIRAAAETMPRPGDKIRAVAMNWGELEAGQVTLFPGMLPIEAPRRGTGSPSAHP